MKVEAREVEHVEGTPTGSPDEGMEGGVEMKADPAVEPSNLPPVIEALRAGWQVALGDAESNTVAVGDDGSVALVTEATAPGWCEAYPNLYAIHPIGTDADLQVVAVRGVDGALDRWLVERGGEEIETFSFVAGSVRYSLFSSSRPLYGTIEVGEGLTMLGNGCLLPLRGGVVGGEVVDVADATVGTAQLPDALREFIPDNGEDDSTSSPLPSADPASDRSLCAEASETPTEENAVPSGADAMPPVAMVERFEARGFSDGGSPLDLRVRSKLLLQLAENLATGPRGVTSTGSHHQAEAEELRALVENLPIRGDLAIADFAFRFALGSVILTPGRDGFALQVDLLWRSIPQRMTLTELVREIARAIEAVLPWLQLGHEAEKAIRKSLRRYFTVAGQRAVADLIATHAGLHGDVRHFDRAPGLIAFTNGMVNPLDRTLHERKPEHYLTKTATVAYVPDAACPEFRAFLLDAFDGDEDAIGFLLKFIGYSLLGHPCLKLMLILFGPTNSGKSLLLSVLQAIFGPIVITAHRKVIFNIHNGSSTDPHTLRIVGSRLAVINESRRGEHLDDVAIKAMTGGLDTVVLRGIYVEPIEVTPTWSVILATNFLPVLPEDDPALLERLAFVRIGQGSRPRDPKLREKLLAEAEGIAALIVEAAHAFLSEGLEMPPSLHELRQEVLVAGREPMDSFFDACFEVDLASSTSAETVRQIARQWFPAHGAALPSDKALGDAVRTHYGLQGVRAQKSGGVVVYRGLRQREVGEEIPQTE